MKISSIIIHFLLVLILFCSAAFAQSLPELEKLKEIKLLESNRDDVLKILSIYELDDGEEYHRDTFSTENTEITVDYSKGNCKEIIPDGYNVPEWKAIFVSLEPKKPIKLESLKLNLSKYKKEKRFKDIDDLYVYYDKQAGIVFTVKEVEIVLIEINPSPKYYGLMCDEEKAKRLSSTSSIFEYKLKERRSGSICIWEISDVKTVNIGFDRIKDRCKSNLRKSEICFDENNIIEIATIATNPQNDILTYNYIVTGGKISGRGDKVLWDLSGVKPGTYTITAAVDNGCGFCGKTITKTIIVKECADCGQITKP